MKNKLNIDKRKITKESTRIIVPAHLEGVVKNKMNPVQKKKKTGNK